MRFFAILSVLFLPLQFGAISIGGAAAMMSTAAQQSRTSLHLIALVPTENENRSIRCVDRGEELILAANMAAEAIFANDTLLQDYRLQIVTARSDNCTVESFAEALTQFVKQVTTVSYNLVGVIGMVCPSTMVRVSPFASLNGINLIQITAGTMPPKAITRDREDRVNIDYVYQTAPASTVYNDALIALMRDQGWRRIATVRLTDGLNIIHVNQGNDLQRKFQENENSDFSIVFNGEVNTGEDGAGFVDLLEEIQNRRARIIYATLPDKEARELLCQSYLLNVTSPLYTWVLHDHSLENLKQAVGNCTEKMMAMALNGVILLHYNVANDRSRNLDYSNMNYGQYQEEYRQRLQNNGHNDMLCGKEPEIVHSNAMYDSVVALAQALDKAETIVNLTQYRRGMPIATMAINDYLMEVEFSGAGGMISFDNETHELAVKGGVNIYRIHDLNFLPFAFYNGENDTIERRGNYSSEIKDSFEEDLKQVHTALSVAILVIVAILVAISIIVLILYTSNCRAPDIKASSPILSMIILVACFILYISAIFTAIRSSFLSDTAYAIFCSLEWWTFVISIQLIFATLFMRLLRVYRIFFHYQKVGKLWSDAGLLFFITLIVSVSIVLLILWTGIDTLRTNKTKLFQLSVSRPHFDVYLDCRSNHLGVWLGLILGYTGLIMIAVLALAVMTRKVRIESFRDTKEVNAFVFTTVFLIAVLIPLSLILEGQFDLSLYTTFILRELCLLLVPVACKAFLFAPKIYYARFADPNTRAVLK